MSNLPALAAKLRCSPNELRRIRQAIRTLWILFNKIISPNLCYGNNSLTCLADVYALCNERALQHVHGQS